MGGPIEASPVTLGQFALLNVTGLALVGAAAAPALIKDPETGCHRLGIAGSLCLIGWLLARSLGGAYLNLRGPSRGDWPASPVSWLVVMCKYPPSLACNLFALGVSGVTLCSLGAAWSPPGDRRPGRPVLVGAKDELLDTLHDYGSAPLFFYLVHMALLSSAHRYGIKGMPAAVGLPLVGIPLLCIMRPLCQTWVRFKSREAPDSWWRVF